MTEGALLKMTVRIEFGSDFGSVEVGRGTSLLAAASRGHAPLGNACRGQGVCRACAVLVITGAELLEPANELEQRMQLEPGWRMACQTRVGASEGSITCWTAHWGELPTLPDPT